MAVVRDIAHGTKAAVGILLLWLGGACLFLAFLSGDIADLTVTDSTGAKTGPKNVSSLITTIAKGIQTQAGVNATPTGGVGVNSNIGGTVNP